MSRVRRVSCDPTHTPPGPGGEQVPEGWEPAANHLLSSTHDALQSVFVPVCGAGEPHGDGGGEDGLNDCDVELHHRLCWQVEFLQLSKKVHPLLGLLNDGSDGGTQEME